MITLKEGKLIERSNSLNKQNFSFIFFDNLLWKGKSYNLRFRKKKKAKTKKRAKTSKVKNLSINFRNLIMKLATLLL